MIIALFAITLLAVILIMSTLGAVLLARFIFGGSGASRRVFAAAIGGPLAVMLPTLGFVLFDEAASFAPALLGFGLLLVMAFGVIGWPVAHFATRRLDRLTAFDPKVFE